jgi:hypothetical protein
MLATIWLFGQGSIAGTNMQFSVHNLIRLSRMGEGPRANYGAELRSWRKPGARVGKEKKAR